MQLPVAGPSLRLSPSTPDSRWHCMILVRIPRGPIRVDCVRIVERARDESLDGKHRSDPSTGKYLGYQWFDPTPYSAPAVGTFGNCPAQGPVRGPGYGDVDLSIQKNFPFTETMKLQFRADFLNAFNRVNLNTPATALGDTMGLVNTSIRPTCHPILPEVLLLIWLVLWGRCSPASAPFSMSRLRYPVLGLALFYAVPRHSAASHKASACQ